jgi:hypothetical protein
MRVNRGFGSNRGYAILDREGNRDRFLRTGY